MLITVFTPAYNRKNLLTRLYESLCKQTYKDFEWVIVDDGSTDGTKELSQTLSEREETFFPLRYFYQENGGKHRAINHGVREAQGELFAKGYKGIAHNHSFAGLCGLDGYLSGGLIGSGLPKDAIDATSIDIRFKYGVTGDLKEVFRTDVLKEYPFPQIEGERFCPEMLVWNRIASKYKLRFINQVIYLAEYQDDGITSRIVKARMNSPVASMMTYAELNSYDIPFLSKVNWTAPFGYFMHLNDLRQLR